MNPKIVIRSETEADVSAITEVTVAAFKTLEISNHTEQYIIAALRAAKALAISLVAELDGRVVGHIAFSPLTISDGTRNWYGLGPVSVLPEYQRQGIGGALIREGLSRLKDMNARGCCLVGHPDYYRKFGFTNTPGLAHEGVPAEVFFALSFDGHTPQGTVTFHEGFKAEQDPNFEARVRASFARQKLMHTIGAKLMSVSPGAVEIELPFRDDLTQQHGFLHAGVIATMGDSACGYAALSLAPADSAVLSVEYKLNLVSPAAGERFIARGRVIKPGRTLTVCAGDVFALSEGKDRKLIATMLSTMMLLADRAGLVD